MDIYAIYKLLLQKKWYLIMIPVFTGLLALFLSGLMPKQYKSVAKLSTGFTTQSSVNLKDERFDFRKSVLKFNNLIETMKSEMILNMVSYNLLIHDLNADNGFRMSTDSLQGYTDRVDLSILKSKKDSFQILSISNEKDYAIKEILDSHGYSSWQINKDLTIRRVRDTDYVTVEFISEDPYLSAFVVNNVAKELIRYYTYSNSMLSNKSVAFFEGQVDKKKAALDEKLRLVNTYKISNPVKDDAEKTALLSKLTQNEMMRDELIRSISMLELSRTNLDNISRENNTTINSNINQRIVDIRDRLNELNKLYIETGSDDEELEQTIENVRSQLTLEMKLLDMSSNQQTMSSQELKAEKDKIKFEIQVKNSDLNRINSRIIALKAQTITFASGSANLEALQSQFDDALVEYQHALDKLNFEKSKSLLTTSSINIAVKGQPKIEPESQKRKLIILFAFFTSFLLTGITIIAFHFIDLRIKTRADFEKNIPIPLTGQLNKVDLNDFQIASIFTRNSGKSNEYYKELLRKLRNNIELSGKNCLLITSLNKGDGKTFFIISLAYSLSLINKKILIIDTNFKNNTLTKLLAPGKDYFLLNSAKNLTDTLLIGDGPKFDSSGSEDNKTKNHKPSIMSPTIYDNVDIIGNNGGLESPLELFSGRDFDSIITTLKEHYDYILMEGPSVNDYSDTMELVNFVDGVISVVKAGVIIKQHDKESLDYLASLNGKTLGGILNQIEEV